jgi:hypothetical protein
MISDQGNELEAGRKAAKDRGVAGENNVVHRHDWQGKGQSKCMNSSEI